MYGDSAAGGMNGCQYGTGEKHVPPSKNGQSISSPALQADQDQANLLGKRTRSGRQTKIIKQSLNEDELDKEFDEYFDEDDGSKRRVKQRHF